MLGKEYCAKIMLGKKAGGLLVEGVKCAGSSPCNFPEIFSSNCKILKDIVAYCKILCKAHRPSNFREILSSNCSRDVTTNQTEITLSHHPQIQISGQIQIQYIWKYKYTYK